MNRVKVVLAYMCLVVVSSFTFAQEDAQSPPPPLPSQYEHVQGLEPLMGVWEGEYQPPQAPKGTIRGVCAWENNRSYANIKWTFAADGSPISVHPFSVRIGFNGKTQAPHFWVTTWEGQAEGSAVIEDGKVTLSGAGVLADGSTESRTVVYQVDGDQLTVKQTDVVEAGEKQPDETLVLRRTSRFENATTQELLKEVQGTWKLDQDNGRWTMKTIKENKSTLLRYNSDGSVRAGHDTVFTLEELDGVKVYRPLRVTVTVGPNKGYAFSPGPRRGYVYTVKDDTWTEAQGLMSHSSAGRVRVYQWKRVNND